jgi:hypothetical protein
VADRGQSDPAYFSISVRPDWTDPSSLLGYFDAIGGGFSGTEFTKAVLLARDKSELPVFVCIDEMNLARVEYYFADILSVMESGDRILFHHLDSAKLLGTDREIQGRMQLPPNLYITGTVNLDETTHEFSPKVLDRALVIDMSKVDLPGFLTSLSTRVPDLAAATGGLTGQTVKKIQDILEPHRMQFGYRVAEEIIRYVTRALAGAIFNEAEALDQQIAQKILTKVKGDHHHGEVLEKLERAMAALPLSKAVVSRMREDLSRYGSFQY